MNEEQPARIQITTDSAQADEFIRKLSTDEGFRADLEADPRAVLARYGMEISPELLEEPVALPPPDLINEIVAGMHAGEFSPEVGAALLDSSLLYFAFRIFRKLGLLPPAEPGS